LVEPACFVKGSLHELVLLINNFLAALCQNISEHLHITVTYGKMECSLFRNVPQR
jgi:hypothetical protein